MGQVRSEGPWTPTQGGCPTISTGHVSGRSGTWRRTEALGPKAEARVGEVWGGAYRAKSDIWAPWGLLGREEPGPCWEYSQGRSSWGGEGERRPYMWEGSGCWMEGDGQKAFKMGDGSWSFSGQSTLAWR